MIKRRPTSMQRDQRVVQHSILGAFWGWLSTFTIYMVFVLVQWGVDVYSSEIHWPSFHDWLLVHIVLVSVFSFFATFAGWLCLGFPIAAVITDRQARSFKFMIIVHTIATESILVIPFLLSWLSNSERSFGEFLYGLFNFLTAWAAAIGFIGGAVFCALERRSLDRQRKLNKHRLFLTQYRLE